MDVNGVPLLCVEGYRMVSACQQALVSFFLQAQALYLLARDQWIKFEYVMKIMRRAPFEVLNFRDHSIPLWGKASSVLGSTTAPYTRTW